MPGPITRLFGGAEVTIAAAGGINMSDRKRLLPVNTNTFTEEKLLQDFVFATDGAAGQGLDILVDFLEPQTSYAITIWSYDNSSVGNRISDWTANGTLVTNGYTFNGTTVPEDNATYRFTFPAVADANGRILIEGRRNAGATVANNVFINALRIVGSQEIRVQSIELTATNTLRLIISGLSGSATHRIDQKTNVADVGWTDVTGATFGPPNGGLTEAIIPVPDTATRFYRVVEEP